jgi:N-acetylmuramic acid 6-phosphate (MurNAc-6-P) etherase
MVRLGRVLSGWMINVRMNSEKLRKRGEAMLAKGAGVDSSVAARALEKSGWNLPVAFLMLWRRVSRREAEKLLAAGESPAHVLRRAQGEWARPARGATSRTTERIP